MRWAVGHQEMALDGPRGSGSSGSLPSKPRPKRPVSSERKAFCMLSLKVRPMLMASPTDFIWVVRTGSAVGNFSKVKRGTLRHDIVDGRLEAGGRFPGNVVGQLVQGVPHCQLGRDLGYRKSGRLRGQGGRARDPRIHLDHHHDAHSPDCTANWMLDPPVSTPISRMHRKGLVPHDLILAIAQGLGRCHGDGIAGVHTHRIEVLDGTNHHAVVGPVPHDLHLELFPARRGSLR